MMAFKILFSCIRIVNASTVTFNDSYDMNFALQGVLAPVSSRK